MKTTPWRELRAKRLSSEKLARIDTRVQAKLLDMDLRELREALGISQQELAAAIKKAQSEVSRIEHRRDWRLATLRDYVHALGGRLEIVADFGNRRVRLRAA
jgi:predicted transcriptional regulator